MASSRWKWAAVGLLLATTFGPAAAQETTSPTAPAQPAGGQATDSPVFRTGVNVVRVDVIVTDSKTGKPVTDLKATDFQVTENNQQQTIDTFKLINLDGGVAESKEG